MRRRRLATVAMGLWSRYEATGQPGDLDDMIAMCRLLIELTPPQEPSLVGFQSNLCIALQERFIRRGNPADADDAIAVGRAALTSIPSGPPGRPGLLSNLANGLANRYQYGGGALGDLDEAIELGRIAVATADEEVARARYRRNLCGCLQRRLDRSGDPVDRDEAIAVGRIVVTETPAYDPERSAFLSNLGLSLRERFEERGNADDLEEAVTVGREAVAAGPPDPIDQAGRRSNLRGALLARYQRDGDLADLDEAIAVMREAVALTPPNEAVRAAYLAGLAADLDSRFERSGDSADLDEAIVMVRAALEATPIEEPRRGGRLHNLANALGDRYARLGRLNDLDEAIAADQSALAATGDPVDRAGYQSSLSSRLLYRYDRLGQVTDLDEAVMIGRAAIAGLPPDHRERPGWQANLGNALQARYDDIGEPDDLEESIALRRAAAADFPIDDPRRPASIFGLATGLYTRFGRSEDPADIEEAIALFLAVPASLDDAHRAMYHNGLANALGSRFRHSGDPGDLDEAVAAARAAVACLPADHPDRADWLHTLGLRLLARFEHGGDPADADESVSAERAAIAATGAGDPARAKYLTGLAEALVHRMKLPGREADLDTAIAAWQELTAMSEAQPRLRLWAARRWADVAAERAQWTEALAGYAAAVELLPLVSWRGAGRPVRERQLANEGPVARDAAACAIATSDLDRAVELLELGRGVLWSQYLETHTDLADLRSVAPKLADRLDTIRAGLDRPSPPMSADGPAGEAVDQRMSLARAWDSTVEEIRALPGLASFLRVPPTSQLRAAATDGPVVVVNVSRLRCDALVVTATGVDLVELPGLTVADLTDQIDGYLHSLLDFEASDRPGRAGVAALEAAITATLEWLWDVLAAPVLAALGYDGTPAPGQPWPRLWWCPTGLLSVLPLHAAGRHRRNSGDTVLDRVISSYTPTLRALGKTGERYATEDGRLLIIALRDTPGQPELPNVDRERDLLARLFPGRHTLREGTAATQAAVVGDLEHHSWAHFSCHGDQYLDDPSRGGVLLYDGPLTIADLSAQRHCGEFAFLAACKTATGGVTVPDEAVTLTAALRYAGWRHVIGTLWSVWDAASAAVTEQVYGLLADGGTLRPDHAAEALHHAVRTQRDAIPDRPSRWAPFIHIGL
jgi:tetratricopeptide (TPR) repeat protein